MKVNKTCDNCEMNGACNDSQNNTCDEWDYSLEYFEELLDGLPKDVQKQITINPNVDVHKVLSKYYEGLH